MKFLKTITLLLSLVLISNANAMDIVKSSFSNQDCCSHLLKKSTIIIGQVSLAAGISYLMTFASTACHEFGHASAAKGFLMTTFPESPIEIFLGAHPKEIFFKSGIHFLGYNPLKGATAINYMLLPNKQIVIVDLAGPLFGICFDRLCGYILKNQNFLPPLTKKLCLAFNAVVSLNHCIALIPSSQSTDGGDMAKRLNIIKFGKDKKAKSKLIIWILRTFGISFFGWKLYKNIKNT